MKLFIMKEKGSTLYFALVILSISSLVVLSVSTVLVLQIQTIKTLGDSVLAFFGADTGLEKTFYEAYKGAGINIGDSFSENLSSSLRYEVWVLDPSQCPPGTQYYCIKSIGTYLPSETKRGMQASI